MSLSLQIALIQLLIPFFLLWISRNYKGSFKSQQQVYIICSSIAILIFSTIEGMRYDVGRDWFQYMRVYEDIRKGYDIGNQRERLELGYQWFNKIIASTNAPYPFFFFVESFLLLGSIVYIFKDNKKYTYIGVALFICMFRFSQENLSRQFLSHTILFLAVYLYFNKSRKAGLALSVISGLFHFSAYPVAVLFYLLSLLDLSKIKLKYIIATFILISIFSELWLKNIFLNYMPIITLFTDRNMYEDIGVDSKFFRDGEIPLRRIIVQSIIFLYCIIIGYKYVAQRKFEAYRTFLYVIASIGLILIIPLQRYELLSRYNFYFMTFFPVFYAYMVNEYKCSLKWKILLYLVFCYFVYCYIGDSLLIKWRFV